MKRFIVLAVLLVSTTWCFADSVTDLVQQRINELTEEIQNNKNRIVALGNLNVQYQAEIESLSEQQSKNSVAMEAAIGAGLISADIPK